MPVILAKERWRVSLADTSLTEIEAMLEPYDARETDAYPVMNRVGSVENDDEGLIKPLV